MSSSRTRRILLAVSTLFLVTTAQAASAQWFSSPGLSAMNIDIRPTGQTPEQKAEGEAWRRAQAGKADQDGEADGAAGRLTPLINQILKPLQVDNATRRATYARHLDQIRKVDAGSADAIAAMIKSGEIQGNMAAAMRGRGLTPDALPDMMAVYWLVGWYASQGKDAEAITPAQAVAVRDQLAITLATTTGVPTATAAQKQQLLDGMFMETLKLDALSTFVAQGDVPVSKVREAAERSLSAVGLTINGVRLTDEGFVGSGGAKADPPRTRPESQPEMLAASDDAATSATAPWLWALGGAAGMGAALVGLRRLRG